MFPSMKARPGQRVQFETLSAGWASRQVLQTDRADFLHLIRMPPDVDKALSPNVSGRKGKLHAREDFAIGRNVAGGVAGAAGRGFHLALGSFRGNCAKLLDIRSGRDLGPAVACREPFPKKSPSLEFQSWRLSVRLHNSELCLKIFSSRGAQGPKV
jgi:hypothetical protein